MAETSDDGLVPTGIAGLDRIICGGFHRGGLYIVEGPPGTGKTTMANQIAYNRARAGDRVVYATLLAESHDRLLRYMGEFAFMDAGLVPDKVSYISAFDALRREGLPGVLDLLRATVREAGAGLLILDGLYVAQERAASQGDFREFIYAMQGVASLHGCTLIFITNGPQPSFSPERTMVDGIIQLGEVVQSARRIRSLQVLKFRGARHLNGIHLFRLAAEGAIVTPRLETLFDAPPETIPAGRIASGIGGLDRMMTGGIPVGSTTLLIGPSGVGKTSIGLLFLREATAEAPGLFFGCYETPDKVRAKAESLGVDVDAMTASGALTVAWHKPFESFLDEMADRMLSEAARTGARRVFIDGIGAFKQAAIFPERVDSFFAALAIRLRQLGATTLCTLEAPEFFANHNLVLDQISAIAENILLLRFAETDEGRLMRLLSVLKMRDSDFDHATVPFTIGAGGIVAGADASDG
ncbi:MAG: ATPase domain-containing protein [Alphaproteobacteria bacterium]